MTEPQKKSGFFGKLVRFTLGLIVLLVLAFVGIGMFVLDGKFDVSRQIVIKAPPEAIHKQVGDLREWPNWLPFTKPKHDPTVVVTIITPTGPSASQTWTSKNGNGKINFTSNDENKGIEYDMLFDEKWPSKGLISYSKSGDGTLVVWRMHGQYTDFMGKWLAAAMGPMVAPKFEEGLKDLKEKVEPK